MATASSSNAIYTTSGTKFYRKLFIRQVGDYVYLYFSSKHFSVDESSDISQLCSRLIDNVIGFLFILPEYHYTGPENN